MVMTPFYEIYIKGKEIPKDMYPNVASAKVNFTHNGASTCTIAMNDPDMIYIEDDLIVEDVPVTVKLGFKETKYVEFKGFVSLVAIDFPEDGTPTLQISCMDSSHLMNRKTKKRTWSNKKVSDVVNEIFKSYGFKTVVDDTGEVKESIEQSDNTDHEFISKLCDEIKDYMYIYYIEGDTAYFVKRKYNQEAKERIVYKQEPYNLLSFSPKINKEDKKQRPLEADIDIKTLKVVQSSMKPNDELLGGVQVANRDSRK